MTATLTGDRLQFHSIMVRQIDSESKATPPQKPLAPENNLGERRALLAQPLTFARARRPRDHAPSFDERIYDLVVGFEDLVRRILELIAFEANGFDDLLLKRISVYRGSAASNIIVDVEVQAEWGVQSAFWDAICDKIVDAEEASGPSEKAFLINRLHIRISRYG